MNTSAAKKGIIPDNKIGHSGELEMRQRFPSPIFQWNELNLSKMIKSKISLGVARFITVQDFFFIATSNQSGDCDASFRSITTSQSKSEAVPSCLISENNEELIVPYFMDDMLSQSLSNISENPHIGMIFIDFIRIGRVRVNGIAFLKEATKEVKDIWPDSEGYIQVIVEQAYGNCPARIPKLYPIEMVESDISNINSLYPLWSDSVFSTSLQSTVSEELIDFIESQSFFFIATADDNGHCDASFRGTEKSKVTNEKLPVAKVVNCGQTLVFPDYSGNALYNSLGNILLNPRISVIFVDFVRIGMLKVSGEVNIEEDNIDYREIWPKAQSFLQVSIDKVDSDNIKIIPRMVPI